MDSKKTIGTIKKFFSDYWTLSIAFALLFILIGAVILPLYKQITDLQERIMIEKNELETKYIRRQTIRRTLLSLQHTKEDWPKLYNSLYPEFGREVDFIHTLEITADARGVIQNLRLEPSLASDFSADILLVPMQLTLTGSFANIMAYMHAIENTSYILNLVDLKFSRIKNDGTVQADIRYDTYWQKQ